MSLNASRLDSIITNLICAVKMHLNVETKKKCACNYILNLSHNETTTNPE